MKIIIPFILMFFTVAFFYNHKSKIELDVDNVREFDDYFLIDCTLVNRSSDCLVLENLASPLSLNIRAENTTDPNSIIQGIIVSKISRNTLKLESHQKKRIDQIVLFAKINKGNNKICFSFVDENENIIAQKNKEIYFKKDIKCENFSKATHKHPTNK